jgi:hypothetical protein
MEKRTLRRHKPVKAKVMMAEILAFLPALRVKGNEHNQRLEMEKRQQAAAQWQGVQVPDVVTSYLFGCRHFYLSSEGRETRI